MSHLKHIITGTVLALWLLTAGSAGAAGVPVKSFEVSIDSGPRLGSLLSGSFSFDASGLTGIGDEFIAIDSFALSFEGGDFTLADDPFAEAVFFDGDFLGLSYFAGGTDFEFSLTAGFFDVSEAFFSYDIFAAGAGFGSIAYAPVPVPAALPLFISAVGWFGLLVKRRV